MNAKKWFRQQYLNPVGAADWARALAVAVDSRALATFDEIWHNLVTRAEFQSLHARVMERYAEQRDVPASTVDYSHMVNITPPLLDWFSAKMVHDAEFRVRITRQIGRQRDVSGNGDVRTYRALWTVIAGESAFTDLFREISAEYDRGITWVYRNSAAAREFARNSEAEREEQRQQEIRAIAEREALERQFREERERALETWRIWGNSDSYRKTLSSISSTSSTSSSSFATTIVASPQKRYCESKTKTRLKEQIGAWRKTLQVCPYSIAQCAVCLDNACNVVFSPCRHMMCCDCAYSTFVDAAKRTCHICGQDVHSIKNALL